MSWFRLDPGRMLLEMTIAGDAEAWFTRCHAIAASLTLGKTGMDPWADEMLSEANVARDRAAAAGRASAAARRRGQRTFNGCSTDVQRTFNGCSSTVEPYVRTDVRTDRPTYVPTDKQTDVLTEPTDRPTDTQAQESAPAQPTPEEVGRTDGRAIGSGKKGGGNGLPRQHAIFDTAAFGRSLADDKYGTIAGIDASLLPEFAAWYCGEPTNMRALRRYSRACQAHPDKFRDLVASFVAEVEGGEEPDSRARAFMARVTTMEAAMGHSRMEA